MLLGVGVVVDVAGAFQGDRVFRERRGVLGRHARNGGLGGRVGVGGVAGSYRIHHMKRDIGGVRWNFSELGSR